MPTTYQIINNRIQFRCPKCKTKKNLAVRPDLRKKRVKCHHCGEVTDVILNRRNKNRGSQTGRVIVVTFSGKELEADLHDISHAGVGFDLTFSSMKRNAISPGAKVRFLCSWNPNLLGQNAYLVRSIRGNRVGAEKVV